jgi:NtrC-family two-component system response regulator AlgB
MRILIVDDENNVRVALAYAVEAMGSMTVTVSSGGSAALQTFKSDIFDVVLLDLELSRETGIDLLDEMLGIHPRTAVIIMAAYASIETAVEAMQRGAFDYLPKPCAPEQIRLVLARVESTRKLENRVAELESRMDDDSLETDLTTKSPTLQMALEVAFKAAESEATILILGETGTGKSVLARALHQRSPRASAAFLTVSCPSLSHGLFESELFGHAKGAFTGSHADTFGKVAAADGGTLFFDEIGELPLEMQPKLLRLLQEREYERVGEAVSRCSNVRVIAATNRNLKECVDAGKFREDLFYRLNVISITMPPLRERMEDIDQLVCEHLKFFSTRSGKKIKKLSLAAVEKTRHYHWPGNLRELSNVIERAVILSSGDRIEPCDLMEAIEEPSAIRLGAEVTLETIKNEHIRRVVQSSGSQKEAAEVLGINPTTIYRHLIKRV